MNVMISTEVKSFTALATSFIFLPTSDDSYNNNNYDDDSDDNNDNDNVNYDFDDDVDYDDNDDHQREAGGMIKRIL